MEPALELSGIGKSFPGVRALQDVSVRLEAGRIHALLGENGAGKSTLIKIITGVHPPDAGTMLVAGRPVRFLHPTDAIAAGIGVVHQERNLIPRFSVGENILLERIALGTLRPIDRAALYAEAARWLQRVGLDIDPRAPVSGLSVATMQMVEIARALSLQSRVLLLDEPTASLTPHETDSLLTILRQLRDQGVAIAFVSHKLEEVQALCDTVTVLRDGRNACEGLALDGMTRGDLVRLMIGRAEQIADQDSGPTAGDTALELRGVATTAGHSDVSFTLQAGEVLGLYGLVGAGRSELARAVIGLDSVTAGEVRVRGQPVHIRSVREALHRFGIGYVSEDRKREGVILLHGVLANAGITLWRRLASRVGWLRDRRISRAVLPVLRQLEVRMASLDAPVANLSGGNQQKVSLAKWLVADASILIIDEPTVGIDVKTKAYLHGLIRDLARQGAAVLVISSDMPELIGLADRILVMHGFRVVGSLANSRDYPSMSEAIMGQIHMGGRPATTAA
jgi:ribose transport system ATP-binding protein